MPEPRKSVNQYPRDCCFFCGSEGPIETHHVVPRRYDGSDNSENLVDLCPTCHRRLESLYNARFYESLGVDYEPEKSDTPTAEQIENVIVTGETPRREMFDGNNEMLKYLISQIEEEYEEGAPEVEVYDRALNDGWFDKEKNIKAALMSLKMKGELSEPTQGKLYTV